MILYTTPHFCKSEVLSLGCTNNECIVFMGRWYTPTSCARKILASFSDVPWMYGRPMLVLARFGLSLSLGSPLGISNAQSSYWLVLTNLSVRFTWALERDHIQPTIHRDQGFDLPAIYNKILPGTRDCSRQTSGHSALTIDAVAGRSLTK